MSPRPSSLDPSASRALWSRAVSFAELCDLGARFVEGELAHFPGWMASATDEESDDLAPHLAALCRAGFLTVASQPGRPEERGHDGRLWRRRAFVCGFAREDVAARLLAASGDDLRVAAHRPGEPDGEPWTVGLRGTDAFLVLGHNAHAEEVAIFAESCGQRATADLARCSWVAAADRRWGRGPRLWAGLAAALDIPPAEAGGR